MTALQYRDVVLHTNAGIFGQQELMDRFPPISERIDLSDRVWIGPLDGETAKLVIETCEPKVFGMPEPVIQFAQLYCFVRELPTDSNVYHWDDDNELSAIVGLSRLVHPTTVGFEYAARLAQGPDGVKEIFPGEMAGVSKQAFLSPNRIRNWLTTDEVIIMRELVPILRQMLPRRVHNALWHHEYAARTYYLDYRWTLVCTGLEALLHTDRFANTLQFTVRVPLLASEFGITISETEARDAYDLRSQLAHGASFLATATMPAPTSVQLRLYDRLEDTLRAAVLRGMRDSSFGDIFRDDAEIRKRWPLP